MLIEPMQEINIDELEKACLTQEQIDCPVIHRFSNGLYIREVHMKADTFAIGHYQNFDHLNIFLKGRVTIINDDKTTTELVAPMIFTGKPGRKAGYIHEDVVWLNVYATNETDIETLEKTFLTKSDYFKDFDFQSLLEDKSSSDDYQLLLNELNVTDDFVKSQAYNESDLCDTPYGDYKFKVGNSKIEGKGIIATAPIVENEIIGASRINGKRTPLGRYTNHSSNPNAKFVKANSINCEIVLIALKNIQGCKGGIDGEEITVNYRDAINLAISLSEEVKICQE